MSIRDGNYCAFYVAEPFSASSLGAHATKDFIYYNLIRSWKGSDTAFPFIDSHQMTYNVRDGSSWELTLKPRLRERLRASKNIILFLSSATSNSQALREEIDYGINDQKLPIIVIYPEYNSKLSLLNNGALRQEVKNLWGKLPIFNSSMKNVPTLHIPLEKELVRQALKNQDFVLSNSPKSGVFFYNP